MPLAVYVAFVLLLAVGILGLSYLLGERHKERATGEPYESGILPTDSARVRLSVQFYLVAMLFLIFDLEVVLRIWIVLVFRLRPASRRGSASNTG